MRAVKQTLSLVVAICGLLLLCASLGQAQSLSGDYVAFYSWASDMRWKQGGGSLPDTNDNADVYVRDRTQSKSYLASVNVYGSDSGKGHAVYPSVADRGSGASGKVFTAFASDSSDLVSDDTNWYIDVFLHDQAKNWAP